VNGVINGESEAAARELLLKQGFQPLTVKSVSSLPPVEDMFPSIFKVKPKEVTMFSRQLATLLEAGIGIVPALQLIQENIHSRLFKKIIADMLNGLRSGDSFSDVLLKHKNIFGELYCQLIAVGERTGSAADSLLEAADYLEKDIQVKKKIKKALTYPAIVLVVSVIVIVILMIFVMPSMTQMFKDMDMELPLTTRLLISVTDFTAHHTLKIFGGLAITALVVAWYMKSQQGRYQRDRLLLKLPVVGTANLMGEMARFSRTLALLLRAGLPIPEILETVKRTSGNLIIKEALAGVRTGLLEGGGLSGPMSRYKLFPTLLVQMVRVGEESGKLESTLSTVADRYEAEADERISNMVSMIEPVMTVGLAVIIGFIALSVITPMYTMTGKFG
jgi:type IV pilus assembly protein PilC